MRVGGFLLDCDVRGASWLARGRRCGVSFPGLKKVLLANVTCHH